MSVLLPAGLVVLRGPAGCGKSTLAARLAADAGVSDAVVSSDAIRAEICGDAEDQSRNADVFALRDARVAARLRAGLPTIADATHLAPASIRGLVRIARQTGAPLSVVDCTVPFDVATQRNASRDRVVPTEALIRQFAAHAEHPLAGFSDEGADVVTTADEVIGWAPAGVDGRHLRGPFDIIGDVHGHLDTLLDLIAELGYDEHLVHPDGRVLVFVGDVIDKGPDSLGVLNLVMRAHRTGRALVVRGNHEHKLARRLSRIDSMATSPQHRRELLLAECGGGSDSQAGVLAQLADDPRCGVGFGALVRWVTRLPTQLLLDGGEMVVVHAAIRPEDIGVEEFPSGNARRKAEGWNLYGPGTGRKDPATGFPERIDWVADYDGDVFVVRGHVTVDVPHVRNRVASTDAGAGDHVALAAFRWPEQTFTTVAVRSAALVEAVG